MASFVVFVIYLFEENGKLWEDREKTEKGSKRVAEEDHKSNATGSFVTNIVGFLRQEHNTVKCSYTRWSVSPFGTTKSCRPAMIEQKFLSKHLPI